MKSLSILLGSLLVVGIMSEGQCGPRKIAAGGGLPADQTKILDEKLQKTDTAKDQTTDGKAIKTK